jgi:two-component system OmpR family response regulator
MRLLVVEDEPDMALLIGRRLDRAGFSCDKAASIGEALEALRQFPYDLVLLDRRLPDGDSAAHIGEIRALRPRIGVMMVSALDANRDKVTGLDAGADDYVTKPFDGPEFLARVRARLRQGGGGAPLPPIVLGSLSFDVMARQALVGGRPFHLHKREFALLEALMRRADRVASRTDLLEDVYGVNHAVSPGALDTLVSRLRKHLAEADAGVEIDLVRGRGYILTEAEA